MQHLVQELAAPPAGMTAVDFARIVGVNRSTLHRIAAGDVQPTLGTLRELAIAHGLELQLATSPLSDPDAAVAARVLLDPAHPESTSSAVQVWVERLERRHPDGAPVPILHAAARASTLRHRPGAVYLRGSDAALRLASAGEASRGRWAVSGRAALALGSAAAQRGPSVLWAEDVERVAQLLGDTHSRAATSRGAHVIVAGLSDSVLVDAFEVDRVRYVAPVQMLLDCIGLGGELADAADAIAKEWDRG